MYKKDSLSSFGKKQEDENVRFDVQNCMKETIVLISQAPAVKWWRRLGAA
jgi:hypothetical protein